MSLALSFLALKREVAFCEVIPGLHVPRPPIWYSPDFDTPQCSEPIAVIVFCPQGQVKVDDVSVQPIP